MKVAHMFRLRIFFISTFCLLMGLVVNDRVLSIDLPDWGRGAAGHIYALMEAEEEEKPLILYFHLDSESWSEKMTSEYLAVYEAWEFLSGIPRVEINPDRSADEEALCNKYGVKQYPAFFVYVPAFEGKPERIHPFSRARNMTVEEFLQTLKDKIVYQYNKKAHSYMVNREYKEALRYYEMALEFDPESAYTYYSLGVVYHSIAFQEKNFDLVKKAEENYLKALKIDPNHKESKKELEKLRKGMKTLGIK
ncbi:MAG: tetratricopeptide repeat protein [Deltaproteobacteria bacterium]|nr:MAG: tetratricopeptide repeat protein [Deltaproteobacteria bacterium]